MTSTSGWRMPQERQLVVEGFPSSFTPAYADAYSRADIDLVILRIA